MFVYVMLWFISEMCEAKNVQDCVLSIFIEGIPHWLLVIDLEYLNSM